MTGNDDSGSPARLLLAERPELALIDILRLEFPADYAARHQWQATLRAAIRYGLLPARMETRQRPGLIMNRDWLSLPPIQGKPTVEIRYFIARDAYRTWRATQPDAPANSLIRLWLTPGVSVHTLPQGEPEPLPQGEPGKSESGAAAKRTALESLLTEIDLRAKKAVSGFNHHTLPGTKDEFARLLKAHCPMFRHIGNERIAAYLKGTCQFQRGAKPEQGKGAAVWALFPEYDLK